MGVARSEQILEARTDERVVLPMHISPFGVKEKVQLKVPKQGLDKYV
jgi:hypothetical protein